MVGGMVSAFISLFLLQEHILRQKGCPTLASSWSLSEGVAPETQVDSIL